MSGDPEQEYFADGMVEEITTAISRLPWLFVIARNSSFTYKGKAVDVKQVARELGVRYVLEGSVRKAGNRVRITGQLIDTATGAHIWADRFDSALDDIFELQDQVASGVVGAIEPKLRLAEIARATRKPAEGLDAYDFRHRCAARSPTTRPSATATKIGSAPVLLTSWMFSVACRIGTVYPSSLKRVLTSAASSGVHALISIISRLQRRGARRAGCSRSRPRAGPSRSCRPDRPAVSSAYKPSPWRMG